MPRFVTTYVMHPLLGGKAETICSRHLSLKAAQKAAKECETRGGAKHNIYRLVAR